MIKLLTINNLFTKKYFFIWMNFRSGIQNRIIWFWWKKNVLLNDCINTTYILCYNVNDFDNSTWISIIFDLSLFLIYQNFREDTDADYEQLGNSPKSHLWGPCIYQLKSDRKAKQEKESLDTVDSHYHHH